MTRPAGRTGPAATPLAELEGRIPRFPGGGVAQWQSTRLITAESRVQVPAPLPSPARNSASHASKRQRTPPNVLSSAESPIGCPTDPGGHVQNQAQSQNAAANRHFVSRPRRIRAQLTFRSGPAPCCDTHATGLPAAGGTLDTALCRQVDIRGGSLDRRPGCDVASAGTRPIRARRPTGVRGHASNPHRSSGTTGRTSIDPIRAGGIRAAIATASSSDASSLRRKRHARSSAGARGPGVRDGIAVAHGPSRRHRSVGTARPPRSPGLPDLPREVEELLERRVTCGLRHRLSAGPPRWEIRGMKRIGGAPRRYSLPAPRTQD